MTTQRVQLVAVQVADDGGQRGADDGLVERGEEQRRAGSRPGSPSSADGQASAGSSSRRPAIRRRAWLPWGVGRFLVDFRFRPAGGWALPGGRCARRASEACDGEAYAVGLEDGGPEAVQRQGALQEVLSTAEDPFMASSATLEPPSGGARGPGRRRRSSGPPRTRSTRPCCSMDRRFPSCSTGRRRERREAAHGQRAVMVASMSTTGAAGDWVLPEPEHPHVEPQAGRRIG